MALHNLAKMTTATTGTGTITLGAAVPGFLTFAQSGCVDGESVSYGITDGVQSEVGRGTYSSTGPTLTRQTVDNSTNNGNRITLSGAAQVFLTPGAGDIDLKNLRSGNATAPALGWSASVRPTGFFQQADGGVSLSLDGKEVLRSVSFGTPGGSSAGGNHYLRIGQDVNPAGDYVQIALSRYGGDSPYMLHAKTTNGLKVGVEGASSAYIDLIVGSASGYSAVFHYYGGQSYSGVLFSGISGATMQARTADYSFTCNWDRQGTVKTYRPGADNDISLGSAGWRWATVYAATSTIATSDARLKTDITDSDLGLEFIQSLRPVRYRLAPTPAQVNDEGKVIAPAQAHTRPHYGLLAQEVKAVLDRRGLDFAGYIDPAATGDSGPLGLRYEEFIAPTIAAVQQLAARVEALEARLAELGG